LIPLQFSMTLNRLQYKVIYDIIENALPSCECNVLKVERSFHELQGVPETSPDR
jgi:hypothetical protein